MVDLVVTVSDDQREGGVELLTVGPKLEYNNEHVNWSAAEQICVSKGGHLASVASPSNWRKMKAFIADKHLYLKSAWLGGTDEAKEGTWTWSDGRKWSYEYWSTNEPTNRSGENCLSLGGTGWYDYPCNDKHDSICSVPTKRVLNSNSQLVFTSENISMPAIQFRWMAQPIGEGKDLLNRTRTTPSSIGGFKLSWKLVGSANVTHKDIRSKSLS